MKKPSAAQLRALQTLTDCHPDHASLKGFAPNTINCLESSGFIRFESSKRYVLTTAGKGVSLLFCKQREANHG